MTWEDEGHYDLNFGVHKSRRYHSKMQAFYQSWHDGVTACGAILSAGAFISLIGQGSLLAQWLTGILAVMSAITFVCAPSKKAQLHGELSAKFTDLAAKIARSDANEGSLREFNAERLEIEKDEPPCRRLVDIQCRNEEARARGVAESKMAPLSRPQRWLGYVFTFGMSRLEKWKSGQTKLSSPPTN